MVERFISGGQSGADQGALRAARACGIPPGGWAPRGWLTEAGPSPWLADRGLVESQEGEAAAERYRARRRRCIADCEAVLLFGDITSPVGRGLIEDCRRNGKCWVWVKSGLTTPRHIADFIRESRVRVLMVAGNRESRQNRFLGIGHHLATADCEQGRTECETIQAGSGALRGKP